MHAVCVASVLLLRVRAVVIGLGRLALRQAPVPTCRCEHIIAIPAVCLRTVVGRGVLCCLHGRTS
jgi:hypothetical protein